MPDIINLYTEILRQELIPAMGCTEPIAVAYAGALARKHLGMIPEKVDLIVSSNIVKNVKSVVVPNTKGRKGLKVAVAAGICYGDPEAELEVLSHSNEKSLDELDDFLERNIITIKRSDSNNVFDIIVEVRAGANVASVHILDNHTNVVCIMKNSEVIASNDAVRQIGNQGYEFLNIKDIIRYANEVPLDIVQPLIMRQIEYNMRIAEEGLKSSFGAGIGKILLSQGNDVQTMAKALAASASDARMGGCELPVVINSGSGNQGITSSVPVIVFANDMHADKEKLIRALLVSNLTTIHLKTGIGSLSAYCGATSAGCGAAAGIAYLLGKDEEIISYTVSNSLAINSGMICDGAKGSCAAKIASALNASFIGLQMAINGNNFEAGDGIVTDSVEGTIDAVGSIAREGMRITDNVIIDHMIS